MRRVVGDSEWTLETRDMVHAIAEPGRFTVTAMVEERPMGEALRRQIGVKNPWIGRTVSEPIEIDIAKP